MGFRQDLSYAMRSFAKAPVFAITTIVMLAIGIGANVAIFALSNAVLLKPLPFAEPHRLMIVHLLAPDREAPGVLHPMIWSYPKYGVFRETERAFESTAIFGGGNWNLTGTDAPERLSGEFVESTYFDVLGVQPAVGRTFTADETRAPGSQPLAMLGYGVWTRRFGADAAVVGRPVRLNGIPHTIIGVLPRGFRGLTGSADLWVPLTTLSAADLEEPFDHSYTVVARRKVNVSAEQADADARRAGGTVTPHPRQPTRVSWSATAVPLDDQRVDPIVRRSILLLLAAVGCVLLIVCVNLANLMLFGAIARQREVAIRLALGASRFRIIRQHMTESAMLGLSGALGGIVVATLILRVGASLMPEARVMLAVAATGGARATTVRPRD